MIQLTFHFLLKTRAMSDIRRIDLYFYILTALQNQMKSVLRDTKLRKDLMCLQTFSIFSHLRFDSCFDFSMKQHFSEKFKASLTLRRWSYFQDWSPHIWKVKQNI